MQIDIFHDTVCPWCRIGKRNLQIALEHWGGEVAHVAYRPFFLNEDIPPQGYDFRPYMEAKGGGQIPLEQFFALPRSRGKAVGLTFNFEAIEKAPNSTLSHRLIALAPEEKKEDIVDGIYAAYFENGLDIGDLDVLLSIAADHGLDTAGLRRRLQSDEGLDEVLADVAWARQQGVSGVPLFIIDNRYAFSGAQPPHLIERVLRQTAQEALQR